MVAVQEQLEAVPVHPVGFRKRQGLAHKRTPALRQRVVPALAGRGLAAPLAARLRAVLRGARPDASPNSVSPGAARHGSGPGPGSHQKRPTLFTPVPQTASHHWPPRAVPRPHPQAGFAFEPTNDHRSSHSRTGGTPEAGGNTPSLKGGRVAAFGEPVRDRMARDAERATQTTSAGAFLLGAPNPLALCFGITVRTRIRRRAPPVGAAQITWATIGGRAVAHDLRAWARRTGNNESDHSGGKMPA
jgi:hypothetical protein